MAKPFIDLRDRVITDTGEVVAKYALLKRRLETSQDISRMRVLVTDDDDEFDVRQYNRFTSDETKRLKVFREGEIEGPAASAFDWNLPDSYRDLDVVERAIDGMLKLNLPEDQLPLYQQRLAEELGEMEHRGMFDFIRALLYVTDLFRARDVVWGVGRGSSCASLVMFVLGINKVDPVKYNIPVEEFLKPGVSDE